MRWFVLVALFSMLCLHGNCSQEPSASLHVTYEIEDAQLLNTVRFWLVDSQGNISLHPQPLDCIEKQSEQRQTVTLTPIKPDIYTLFFVYPNRDMRFERSQDKTIEVTTAQPATLIEFIKQRQRKVDVTKLDSIFASAGYYQLTDKIEKLQRPLYGAKQQVVSLISHPEFEYVPPYEFFQQSYNFSVTSNLQEAKWMLYQGQRLMYRGKGSVPQLYFPPNQNYRLVAEDIEGYLIQVSPSGLFEIAENERVFTSILYTRQTGALKISSFLPEGERVKVILEPLDRNLKPFTFELQSDRGKIFWESHPIPTGNYRLIFEPPGTYLKPEPELITISSGNETFSLPIFQSPNHVRVSTNQDEAIFTITEKNKLYTWTGKGKSFEFKDLPDGNYLLSFTSESPQVLIPPSPISLFLRQGQTRDVQAEYHINKTSSLVPKDDLPFSQEARLVIKTNSQEASYEIRRGNKSIGQYRGKLQVIPIEPGDNYSLSFGFVPNFESPEEIKFSIETGKMKEINVSYRPFHALIMVPAGELIMGDPFGEGKEDEKPTKIVTLDSYRLGAYEVTNSQYAAWLNEALNTQQIEISSDSKQPGRIFDKEGHLLFITFEGNSLSQISLIRKEDSKLSFAALPGKDQYPVIFVSWYGAHAYCQAYHFRLPSEAEWERAAAMDPIKLKKFRYGFGKDTIDRTWANYKSTDSPLRKLQVLSSLVGFYNGSNTLSLTENVKQPQETHDAVSPFGAYDMSGNVYEWTNDWYASGYRDVAQRNPIGPNVGEKKVVKGGCYDSLSSAVRVAARLPLEPSYLDEFTGFRVAK